MKEEKNIYQQIYNSVVFPVKTELSLIERIEQVYIYLEQIAKNEAQSFSNSSKANLRRAQVELQRIRLLLMEMVSKPPKEVFY